MPAKTLILVNPVAGAGRARLAERQVAGYLRQQDFRVDFVEPRDAEELQRRAAEGVTAGYERIVALGGDGTFQRVVKATLGSEVVLGFIPAGGGNDIAAALGIPKDPVEATHVFLHSPPRQMDVVRACLAGGKTGLYVGCGGLGLDAEAAGLASGKFRRLPGAARYIAGVLLALATFHPFRLQIMLDGQAAAETHPVMFVAVANTPTYGAGVKIAPKAKTDDGLLDLVVVRELSWPRLVEAIPIMLQSGELRWAEIYRFRARRVCFQPDRPTLFHGDGEVLGEAPVEIENLPGAIRVAAPGRR